MQRQGVRARSEPRRALALWALLSIAIVALAACGQGASSTVTARASVIATGGRPVAVTVKLSSSVDERPITARALGGARSGSGARRRLHPRQ